MLTLLADNDPILRRVAEPVTIFDQDLESFVIELQQTMANLDGIGIAAPQVGVSKRIIISGRIGALINPVITKLDGMQRTEEGCLTFPGLFSSVQRSLYIEVQYQDLNGIVRECSASGLQAVILQHEIDHLDGKLFVDYLKPVAMSLALRKQRKRQP